MADRGHQAISRTLLIEYEMAIAATRPAYIPRPLPPTDKLELLQRR